MKKNYFFLLTAFVCSLEFSFAQITLTQFASGFTSPVDIKSCGDDRLFVVEQAGRIRIIDTNGVIKPGYFLDIHTQVYSGGELGCLGLAFDPNYATNGYFYVEYTVRPGNVYYTKISRFQVSATNPDSADASSEANLITIWDPASNHNGGNLVFGPDGYLYSGLGDGGGGGDPGNRSQNIDTLWGKLLRFDVSQVPYLIPPDNP